MKNKLYIPITVFALCLSLCGCNQNKPTPADYETGSIVVTSGGKTYSPLENWIFSHEQNGTIADGARKQPSEVAVELEAIPYGDDFELIINGEPFETPSYTLYNDKLEEEYYRQPNFNMPQSEGEYILAIELSWGNEENYSGYQYFFKLTLEPFYQSADQDEPDASPSQTSESIAFIVCSYLGLDTSGFSFQHIAKYSLGRERNVLEKFLDAIQKTALYFIDTLDGIRAAHRIGYKTDEFFLFTNRKTAFRLFRQGYYIYLVYPCKGELLAMSKKELEQYDGPFAVLREDWFGGERVAA